MLVSTGTFAYLLNSITEIIVALGKDQKGLNNDIEIIERYMARNKVKVNLKNRVIDYLKWMWSNQNTKFYEEE